eukprot:NODE_4909_length_330_cov_317.398577_g4298_i0.p1 GENE.NODE_4909_length_330_cov_317.398577_g4298_i0~~NODE_4909_length_330_cov_317.398577_g4298_i0.p1  ORF type:complete len:80 (+),score=22.69 NODE_4909_length_330_cov_317.398577_g4298_i0:28-240(+)
MGCLKGAVAGNPGTYRSCVRYNDVEHPEYCDGGRAYHLTIHPELTCNSLKLVPPQPAVVYRKPNYMPIGV